MLEAVGLAGEAPAEPPRLVVGAPLPVGMTADAELADLLLPVKWAVAPLRERLQERFPPGHRLVALHDVWLGEPALPGIVVAGDYLVTLGTAHVSNEGPAALAAAGLPTMATDELRNAIDVLLAATVVPRTRIRGDRTTVDNLRTLVLEIRVAAADRVWMRLRIDPVLGTGRPDDVLDALGAIAGAPFRAVRRHRERLWLRSDLAV